MSCRQLEDECSGARESTIQVIQVKMNERTGHTSLRDASWLDNYG